MLEVRQRVDHGHLGGAAPAPPVAPARTCAARSRRRSDEAPARVFDRLAAAQLKLGRRQHDRMCRRRATATSNETRVRVDGFSKINATERPRSARRSARGSAFTVADESSSAASSWRAGRRPRGSRASWRGVYLHARVPTSARTSAVRRRGPELTLLAARLRTALHTLDDRGDGRVDLFAGQRAVRSAKVDGERQALRPCRDRRPR